MTELLDVRLLAAAVAAWLGALLGFLSGPWSPKVPIFVAALTLVVAGVLVVRSARPAGRVIGIALAALAVGAGAATMRLLPLTSAPVPELVAAGAAVRGEVVLTSDAVSRTPQVVGDRRGPELAEATANLVRVTARGRTLDLRVPVLLRGSIDLLGIPPGTRLAVVGVLRAPGLRVGIAGVISLRESARVIGTAAPIWRATTALRADLARACTDLPPDIRGLLPGLAVGDVSAVPPELISDMKVTGLTHLVAVSGTNTALVLAALLALCAALRFRRWLRVGCALAGLGGFVLLVRPQPSVSRAAVMGVVMVLALIVGGRRRALPALCAAILLLVLVDPWLAISYGFALSTVATAGLVLVAPSVRDGLRRRLPWCPGVIMDAVAVSAAAQIAATPLLVSLSGYFSVVSLPANVLAAPAVGPATVLGVLATLLAPISPPLADVVVHLAAVPTAWIAWLAHRFAGFSWATVPWTKGLVGGLATFVVIVCIVLLFRLRRLTGVRWWVVGVVVSVLLIGVGTVPRIGGAAWPPPSWALVVCDVGQGDGLVLRVGPGAAVVVDTGPLPALMDRCLKRLGISRVAVLVLTHFHADHVAGLAGVLRHRSVGAVLATPYREPVFEADAVSRTLAAAHIRQAPLVAGAALSVGGAVLRALWPPPPTSTNVTGLGPNDDSIVLLVDVTSAAGPVRLLLTADVGPDPQAEIKRRYGPLGVSVVKIAHHGSAYQAEGFASWLHAPLAVVSVGRDNPFGHPVAATLASYRASGATVVRTDESGDIAVTVDPKTGALAFATHH